MALTEALHDGPGRDRGETVVARVEVRELVAQARRCAAERRVDDAKDAYLAALRLDADDVNAMTGLGDLLASLGLFGDARVVLEETVRRHPRHADAYRGLVLVCNALGDKHAADEHSRREFALRPIHIIPFTGTGDPVRLLLVSSALGINTRTARFRDRRLFETITVAAEFIDPGAALPAHDVVFNAIGDADRAPQAIRAAERVVAKSDRPILNHPASVRATNRVDNAARLGALPGVVTARTLRIPRARATDPALARELGWPFLLRVPGHHTGEYFERVDDPTRLDAALAKLPGSDLLAMSFLDARDAAGRYRKYRMIIVDGVLYPLHAAIGAEWKLHFFSGSQGTEERALDQAFLADPQTVIGASAHSALDAIAKLMRLDYGGIDFALDPAGNVLVFEANATMTVPEAELDPALAYRNEPLDVVARAVTLLFMRAGTPAPSLRGARD